MEKHKYTREEVLQWQADHNRYFFYINKDDSNLFVPRGRTGLGFTLNLAHPISWVIIILLVGVILCFGVFRKLIFG